MKRRNWMWAGVGIAAAAAGVGWSLRREGAAAPSSTRPSAPTAADAGLWSLTVERPQGGALALASLRGQPMLLNFWATWCPPCLREFPLLDGFQREHAAKGWTVLALAVDNAEAVRQFLAKNPVSFTVGIVGFDGLQLTRDLGNTVGALPFTVAFDRRGQAIERKLGEVDAELLGAWAKALQA